MIWVVKRVKKVQVFWQKGPNIDNTRRKKYAATLCCSTPPDILFCAKSIFRIQHCFSFLLRIYDITMVVVRWKIRYVLVARCMKRMKSSEWDRKITPQPGNEAGRSFDRTPAKEISRSSLFLAKLAAVLNTPAWIRCPWSITQLTINWNTQLTNIRQIQQENWSGLGSSLLGLNFFDPKLPWLAHLIIFV